MTEERAVLVLRDGLFGPSYTFDAEMILRFRYGWPENAVKALRRQFP